ncbi:MAG: FAD/NAD(P)-binding protein [Gaiella sp.]
MSHVAGRTIAVVGAGFCGTMVAVHVLRLGAGTVRRVVLVERVPGGVGGVAYRTGSSSHTLNVPAGRMSAFQDDPDGFLRFAREREPALTGGSFVPRRLYGEYLASTLAGAERGSRVPLTRVAGEVVDVAGVGEGAEVRLADGRAFHADDVVLAIGNYPPSDPPGIEPEVAASLLYARDPWADDALEVDRDEAVLLVGTGLTACDIALALRDSDQRGRIVMLSRRGLLPQAHRVSAKPPPHLDRPTTIDDWADTARGLLRGLRAEVRAQAEAGVDWREVVTSIRHDTPALWQRLDERERRAFLRHLRPYWETHRHRASPETMLGIESMIEEGALEVVAGRLVTTRLAGRHGAARDDGSRAESVVVGIARRGGGGEEELRVGKVVNCTGPDTDLTRVADPLVAALRDRGAIRPDALGLGLDSDAEGRALDATGTPSPCLSVLGPLRKGRLWENTAVPELRVEALRLAERLVDQG